MSTLFIYECTMTVVTQDDSSLAQVVVLCPVMLSVDIITLMSPKIKASSFCVGNLKRK